MQPHNRRTSAHEIALSNSTSQHFLGASHRPWMTGQASAHPRVANGHGSSSDRNAQDASCRRGNAGAQSHLAQEHDRTNAGHSVATFQDVSRQRSDTASAAPTTQQHPISSPPARPTTAPMVATALGSRGAHAPTIVMDRHTHNGTMAHSHPRSLPCGTACSSPSWSRPAPTSQRSEDHVIRAVAPPPTSSDVAAAPLAAQPPNRQLHFEAAPASLENLSPVSSTSVAVAPQSRKRPSLGDQNTSTRRVRRAVIQPEQIPTPMATPVLAQENSWSVQMQQMMAHMPPPASRRVIDEQRISLLGQACAAQDVSFLLTHQLYCLAFTHPPTVMRLGFGSAENAGLATLEPLIIPNRDLSWPILALFARFPYQLNMLSEPPVTGVIEKIKEFLLRFGQRWDNCRRICVFRQAPPCCEELVQTFAVASEVMQRTMYISLSRQISGYHSPEAVTLFEATQQRFRKARDQPGYNLSSVMLDPLVHAFVRSYRRLIPSRPPPSPIVPSNGPFMGGTAQAFKPGQARSFVAIPAAPSIGQTQFQDLDIVGQPQSRSRTPVHATFTQPPVSNDTFQSDQRHFVPAQSPIALAQGRRSSVLQPSALQPSALQPSALQPSVLQPSALQPSALQPSALQPLVLQPSALHPSALQPPVLQPSVRHPSLNLSQAQSAPFTPSSIAQRLDQTSARAMSSVVNVTSGPTVPTDGLRVQQDPLNYALAPVQRHSLEQAQTTAPLLSDALLPHPSFLMPQTTHPNPDSIALHQTQIRSPPSVKIPLDGKSSSERLYRYSDGFILPPQRLDHRVKYAEWSFNVPADLWAKKARRLSPSTNLDVSATRMYRSGTIFLRLKSIKMPEDNKSAPPESEFAEMPVSWPTCVFVSLNDVQDIDLRRKTHWGRDLTADLTDLVIPGDNVMKISFHAGSDEEKIAYCLAVEVVRVENHESIGNLAPKLVLHEDALASILALPKTRDDDEVSVADASISIDLVDPITSTIWRRPARGNRCKHRECFDVDAYLLSRPSTYQNGLTDPDRWKCPICGKDARPQSLVVDGFLMHVREQLRLQGRLEARAILVKPDGSWEAKVEQQKQKPDHDGATRAGNKSKSSSAQPEGSPTCYEALDAPSVLPTGAPLATNTPKLPPEVIEIQDDYD